MKTIHTQPDQPATVTDTSASPYVRLHGLGLTEVEWTTGFWADRFRVCREAMVPVMGRLLTETERVRFLGNFLVAAGKIEGRHRGPKWNDGDFYKWLESAAALYAVTQDPQLDAHLDQLIEIIAAAQEPDGYIHTDVTIRRRAGEDVKRFGNPMDFEMYNMGHLMLAGCMHHRATKKDNLFALARKAADFLCREFASPTPQHARHGICPIHLSGLVELYRTTRDRRYLDLAVKLLNMRDLVTSGDDDNQDRIPFRQQTQAVGHAVRATYLYAGAADIYQETGDETLLAPLEKIWQDLVSRKLYITGGCGALFDGASPDGSKDQAHITRVHQAFGRNYQLPHSTAHNETCAAIGNLLWNWRMLQITGEARFADVIETTLYNSVLAGVSLDGTRFFYTNTLRQLQPMPVELRWPRQRQAFMSCWCCPPNVVRTLAEIGHYAYAISDRGLSVILYGSNRLQTSLPDGTKLRINQQTDYPWDGKVRLTIEQADAAEFSLMLRIPGWARGATVRVNGETMSPTSAPGTFFEVRRRWSAGDVVELDLPMPVRLIEANPYVEEARNQAAVVRGPVVYCLESPDLPAGVRVLDVYLPRDVRLSPRRRDDLLGGVAALEGNALAITQENWDGRLYRDLPAQRAQEIDLTLIPYYAWDNRGESEMSVWLPLA